MLISDYPTPTPPPSPVNLPTGLHFNHILQVMHRSNGLGKVALQYRWDFLVVHYDNHISILHVPCLSLFGEVYFSPSAPPGHYRRYPE